MKIKNYNLLSSVTLSGVIDWIWIINEVTEVGDSSVTANFAVTLPCFQWLLMGCWLGYTELFSFSRLKLLFLLLGTKVSSAWNFSFKGLKQSVLLHDCLFQALKPIVSRHETLCFAICSKKAMPRNQRFLLEIHSLNSATRALLTSIFSLIPEY